MRGLQLILFRDRLYALYRALEGGERGTLAEFSLDIRTLNKISIAAAYSLPTSKAVDKWIDLDLKHYIRGEFKNKCDSSNISVQRLLAKKLQNIYCNIKIGKFPSTLVFKIFLLGQRFYQ
jgi:hypothetical protein